MQALSSTLRNQLERTVIAARDVAEEGALAALKRLAVNKPEALPHMTPEQRDLRVKLRAKGRQLGDVREKNGEQDIYYLHRECAYEYWHQMLFARFLAENQLLMHPDGVAVTLGECEELAADEGTDGWTLAGRYASRMLPQIFRPDDPLLQVNYAPEDKQALEKLLADLPVEVFTADDSLGWVYQFWQTKRKKEINESGEKIGADELPAVTQLFTEDYMVKFLLHNTLGAWWAGKELTTEDTESTETEEELRQKVALPGVDWEYLRFVREEPGTDTGPSASSSVPSVAKSAWRPAAGTFPGWPKQAAELKIMDPCCGSGHFLVAAFDLMVRIRMEEEGLDAAAACDTVLRDNLFGLEIDPRCTQIAAFALAFVAWTFPDAGGYRALPELHIACTGIGPQATEEQWIKLAEQSGIPMPPGGKEPIRNGLINLHRLFSQAPTLGSLIDPNELPADLIAADYETLQPYLASAMADEHADEETHERAVAARGIVKAAELLAYDYNLLVTNVPYLSRQKWSEELEAYIDTRFPEEKQDLANVFVERCSQLAAIGGAVSAVTPQGWLFASRYQRLREKALATYSWDFVAKLGPGAFETISGEVVNVALVIWTRVSPAASWTFGGLDVTNVSPTDAKARSLAANDSELQVQTQQLKNPDCRIVFGSAGTTGFLREYAESRYGLRTADAPRFIHCFWELPSLTQRWEFHQSTVDEPVAFGGREHCLLWDSGDGVLREYAERGLASLQGEDAWSGEGVVVSLMGKLPCTRYTGDFFDNNCAALWPKDASILSAVWAYCSSEEFGLDVRKLDTSIKVTNLTLLKVPFDLASWEEVAAEKYPDGLPEPESDDPMQWLFHGYPGAKVAEASSLWSEEESQDGSATEVVETSRLCLESQSQDGSATVGYFDPHEPIANLTGDLPHWRQENVTYFVTFRCADALPQEKLDQWRRELAEWHAAHSEPHDARTRREFHERFPARLQTWLDAGYGLCPFRDSENRRIVEAAINHFSEDQRQDASATARETRYDIIDRVVAANHVHVIVTPLPGHELSDILHSWKSFTANQVNRRLNRTGALWQKESFDHIVRSPESLEKFLQYIRAHDGGDKVAAASSRRVKGKDQRQDASATLQVAVARLLGYRWPAELDEKMRLSKRARGLVKRCDELLDFADADGIVCIPAVAGERTAADCLLSLLSECGVKSAENLEDWLRDKFFIEHCQLFHQRPFIWHIWDGRRKDGFHALVNYHKLDRKLLEKLIYTHLGDWIARQKAAERRSESGAEGRRQDAEDLQDRLKLILEGEPPYDIFIRWKPLEEQPIGWDPEVNDGVRINIRPFVEAGVLRKNPKIKWKKDRGKEPERPKEQYPWFWSWDEETQDFMGGPEFDGNRWNDCHYSSEVKHTARAARPSRWGR